MRKLMLFLILGIFLTSLVPAAIDTNDVDDIFRVNTIVPYAKACFNDGDYCSASTICNYTVFNPDNTILYNNVQATNNISNYNFSMTFPEVNIYQIDMVCTDGSDSGAETFYAQVTSTGLNENLGFYIVFLILAAAMIVFGLKMRDAPITIFGSFMATLIALYSLRFGIVGISDSVYTTGVSIVLLGVSFYILVKSSFELINA